MPPDDDPTTDEGQDPIGDAIDASTDPTPASTALSADAVRNSPEYKAMVRQNRKLARDLGNEKAATVAARTEAETSRQAAEAQQQAALEAQISAALGEEGVAFWDEFAELSATDPVAAAKRLAEVLQSKAVAQSAAGGEDAAAGDPDAGEGTPTVPAQTPPPPSRGVDGGAPLGAASTGEDTEALVAGLTKTYTDTVARVQDPLTRNRVTMKDRAAAFISYVAASYVTKIGNTPRGGNPAG